MSAVAPAPTESTSDGPGGHQQPRRRAFLPVLNVLASNLNTALAVAGAFAITPAILHGLGDSAYGGWLLMNSMVGYMRLLDQGTSIGTMRLGAGALARHDQREVRRVFDTSAALFIIAGTLAIVVSFVLAWALPRYYGTVIGGNQAAIFVLGLATALDLAFRVFPASLRTKSLFLVVDGVEIVTYSIFKLGLVLYLSNSLSYLTLSWIMLGECLLRNALVVVASHHYSPFIRHLQPFRADGSMFRELVVTGAAFSVLTLADIVRFQLDAGVIGYLLPSDPLAISIFGIGQRLPSIAFTAIGVIGAVLIPRFSGLAETGDHHEVTSLLRMSSLVTGLASVYVLVNCAVLGPQFLLLWLKKPWVAESGQILLMLLPAYFIALQCGPSAGLLVARGKLRGQIAITVVEALANLGLSVALVRTYGIAGVAVGTIVPMLVVRGFLFPLVVRQELGISLREYYAMHAKPFVLGLVYLAVVGSMALVRFTSYESFVALGLLSTTVFVALVFAAVPEARAVARQWSLGRS